MGIFKGSFEGPFKGIYRDSIRVFGLGLLEGSWSYNWGYKSLNMAYNYSYPTYDPTYNYTQEPPSVQGFATRTRWREAVFFSKSYIWSHKAL